MILLITVKDIAKISGVSISTVSNILNGKTKCSEETKQRVLEVVKETGYQPNYFAQGIRKQNTNIIGIITEDLNEFTTPIVEAAMASCEEYSYRSVLINMRVYDKWQDTWYNDEVKLQSVLNPAIQELLSIKVDGIIYIAGHCRVINCFPDNFNIPAVVTYAFSKQPQFTSVVIDDEKGGYDLTKYLISKGHNKIGVIAGRSDNLHTQLRSAGYQKALFEHQIPYNPQWIYYGDWQRRSGYDMAKDLLKENITAIFCMNDRMAAGVYDYCYENNMIVGEDISIVGYDNIEVSEYLRPALTTNQISLDDIGYESAEVLVNLLLPTEKKNSNSQVIKIPCSVVLRESVKQIF